MREKAAKVQAAIDFYNRLAPKVKLGCRMFEANNLLELGKTIASSSKRKEIKLLLDNKFNVRIGCECTNDRCEWVSTTEGSDFTDSICSCLTNGSFCKDTYVYGNDRRTGFYAYGRVSRREEQ
jgi:hypothetical protein